MTPTPQDDTEVFFFFELESVGHACGCHCYIAISIVYILKKTTLLGRRNYQLPSGQCRCQGSVDPLADRTGPRHCFHRLGGRVEVHGVELRLTRRRRSRRDAVRWRAPLVGRARRGWRLIDRAKRVEDGTTTTVVVTSLFRVCSGGDHIPFFFIGQALLGIR